MLNGFARLVKHSHYRPWCVSSYPLFDPFIISVSTNYSFHLTYYSQLC